MGHAHIAGVGSAEEGGPRGDGPEGVAQGGWRRGGWRKKGRRRGGDARGGGSQGGLAVLYPVLEMFSHSLGGGSVAQALEQGDIWESWLYKIAAFDRRFWPSLCEVASLHHCA